VAAASGRGAQVVDLYQKVIDDAYDAHTARTYQARRATLLASVLGRVDDALEALRHLVEIAPKDLESIHAWQSLLREHDRHQDLVIAIERELQAGAEDPLALRKEIAVIWEQKLKNTFEARDAWKKVQKLSPDDVDVRAAFERLDRRRSSVDLDEDMLTPPPEEPIDELSSSEIDAPPAEPIDELSSSEIDAPPADESDEAGDTVAPPAMDSTPPQAEVTREVDEAAASAILSPLRIAPQFSSVIRENTSELTNPDLPTAAFSAPAPTREPREDDPFPGEETLNITGRNRPAPRPADEPDVEPEAPVPTEHAFANDEASSEHLVDSDLEALEEAEPLEADALDEVVPDDDLEPEEDLEPVSDLDALSQMAVGPREAAARRTSFSPPPPPPPRASFPPPPPAGASRGSTPPRKS
ncbi:MAG: tetratricopeptide repeat protein, partial [Deltaproteobacteria bacterium]